MRKLVPILLKKWRKKVGVKVKEVKIRKMKTKTEIYIYNTPKMT